MATVPNVVGLTLTAALSALAAAGLYSTKTPPQIGASYSKTVASGLTISSSPAAGAVVPSGTNVTVIISAGVAPVAGNGYDQWGASGGGITAVNTAPSIGQNLSDSAQAANAIYLGNLSVAAALSSGAIPLIMSTPAYLVPTTPKVGA